MNKRKLRILHAIFSTEFAGSERYCADLARLQAEAGHEVRILIKRGKPEYEARFKSLCGKAQVVGIPSIVPSILDGWIASRVMIGFEADTVHCHLGRAAKRVGRAAKKLGIPAVATLHLDYRAKDYAHLDGLICIADWQRDKMETKGNAYAGKVITIGNWVPELAEPESWQVAGVRHALGAAGATVVLGSIGRLVDKKGMDVLVRAFRKAFTKDENVRLAIVGDGPDRVHVGKLAEGDGRIAVLGYRDDLAALYGAFDVYVSAARYEPFGLTIVEAMQAGCNLVTTRTDGPSEFLAEYEGIGWADAGDVDDLARVLKVAVKRGKRRVDWDMTPFDPEVAAAAIERFYAAVRPV